MSTNNTYGFNTKAYTLNSLITEVAAINSKASIATLVTTLSPRAGVYSVKFEVIDTYLNGYLNDVLHGYTSVRGTNARTRLLNALKYRKANGFFTAY